MSTGSAEGLHQALGELAGFGGSAADYEDVRSSLLHEVLRRGRGLPITLSVVWCEVSRLRDLDAAPLELPGHVLVRVGDHVVDPFAGGRRVRTYQGEPVLEPIALLTRVLTNIRVLAARQERSLDSARTRLWATELSSCCCRTTTWACVGSGGELLVRLGDHVGGAEALEDYALVIDDNLPDEAEQVRRSARQARAQLN